MTNEEAIKYLQQLYPYGGYCWLDEQRTEAIGMAINALQEEPVSEQSLSNVQRTVKNGKEPVSEDLSNYIDELSKQFPEVSFAKLSRIAVRVTKWKEQQMTKKAINAIIEAELDSHGADYGIQKIKCTFGELEAKKLKNGARVKLVIVKED